MKRFITVFLMMAAAVLFSAGVHAKEINDELWPSIYWSDEQADKMTENMKKHFDSMLKESFHPRRDEASGFPVNIWEDKDNIYVEATVPGREIKDINVTVDDGRILKIEAKGRNRTEEKGKDYYRMEFYVGDLVRELQLPSLVDPAKIDAKYDKGMLKITLSKKEKTEKSSVKIEVK